MDTHSTLHHRRHQVRHISLPFSNIFVLFILSFSKAKKASPQKKDYSFGVNARRNLMKKSMYKISHTVGLMDLPCSCAFMSLSLGILTESVYLLLRCALIHCHRPDLLDYNKLDKVGVLIFSVAFIDHWYHLFLGRSTWKHLTSVQSGS